MDRKPSNKLLAEQSGLTVAEVGTYLTELVSQPDGSWIAYFGAEIERITRCQHKVECSTNVIDPSLACKALG